MVRVILAALLAASCVAAETGVGRQTRSHEWVPERTNYPYPLPEITRDGNDKTAFAKPSVVLLVKFRQRWQIEELSVDLDSLDPPTFFQAGRADVYGIVRVNERRREDPDLARMKIVVDQKDRKGHEVPPFEFGRFYLLLLNAVAKPFYIENTPPQTAYDSYTLAVPQGGFEVVNGRLRVLAKGGDLDVYDGRDANEVIRELQPKQRK